VLDAIEGKIDAFPESVGKFDLSYAIMGLFDVALICLFF